MKFTTAIILTTALALVGCGDSESTAPESSEKPKVTKQAKFKGSKLAPPQETMNYWAGIGTAEKRKYIRKSHPEHKSACRWHGPQLYWATPDKIDNTCRDLFDGFAAKTIFKPSECFKGLSEGSHEFSDLTDAISCEGQVESPIGNGQVRLVMHKVNNDWYGFTESYKGWTE